MPLHCRFVREQLSAYMDGEQPVDKAYEIEQHLDSCQACSHELMQFRQLGKFARGCIEFTCQPPTWEMFSQKLSSDSVATNYTNTNRLPRDRKWILFPAGSGRKIAATLVVLAATLLLFFSLMIHNQEDQSAINQASIVSVDLHSLLEMFPDNAATAINSLIEQFALTEVTLTEADFSFGYPTYVGIASKKRSLPGDAKVTLTKMFPVTSCECAEGKCTCPTDGCHCIACICERPDGSTYLVFEQCKSQTVRFEDFSEELVIRDGREFRQLNVDGMRAVSIDRPTGRLTVVGLRSDEEVATFLAGL